ncbi:MAG TPA: delta-60 repeat domain-containing protein [Solirubrobacterales bacterium]|nr:delta-60 repeat domain-containing protein [Solirubrobacterales bacterium]
MKKILLSLVLAAVMALPLSAEAKTGALDPSFGDNGRVVSPSPREGYTKSQIAQAPGGTVYVLEAGVLQAFSPNGRPDRAFGNEGTLPLSQRLSSTAFASFAIDLEGRVVVASSTSSTYGKPTSLILARLLPDGQLDPSFGSGGIVTTDLGLNPSEGPLGPTSEIPSGVRVAAQNVTVDQLGRIVVLTSHVVRFEQTKNGPIPITEGVAARFGSGGALDPSYGSGGVAIGFAPHAVQTSAFAPDGSVFVAVPAAGGTALRHLTADGRLDLEFGSEGWRLLPPESEANFVADGRGVVIWRSQHRADPKQMTVRRLQADGRLDRGFGRNGVFRQNFGINELSAVVPDGTGGYFLAATWRRKQGESIGAKKGLLLGRLTSRGTFDKGFGRVKTGFGQDAETHFRAMGVDRRGRPLLLGSTMSPGTGGEPVLALARYRPPR